jgi:hypothetical protein
MRLDNFNTSSSGIEYLVDDCGITTGVVTEVGIAGGSIKLASGAEGLASGAAGSKTVG